MSHLVYTSDNNNDCELHLIKEKCLFNLFKKGKEKMLVFYYLIMVPFIISISWEQFLPNSTRKGK